MGTIEIRVNSIKARKPTEVANAGTAAVGLHAYSRRGRDGRVDGFHAYSREGRGSGGGGWGRGRRRSGRGGSSRGKDRGESDSWKLQMTFYHCGAKGHIRADCRRRIRGEEVRQGNKIAEEMAQIQRDRKEADTATVCGRIAAREPTGLSPTGLPQEKPAGLL